MTIIVRKMREECAVRANSSSHLDSFRNTQMRRMLTTPERVDHKHPGAAQGFGRRIGNRFRIGDVCQGTYPIREHVERTMRYRNRGDGSIAYCN